MVSKYDKVGSIVTRTIEECSEVIHILCKVDRFGWGNFHPLDESKTPNYLLVAQEVSDLEHRLSELKIILRSFGAIIPNPEISGTKATDAQQLKAAIALVLEATPIFLSGSQRAQCEIALNDLRQRAAV